MPYAWTVPFPAQVVTIGWQWACPPDIRRVSVLKGGGDGGAGFMLTLDFLRRTERAPAHRRMVGFAAYFCSVSFGTRCRRLDTAYKTVNNGIIEGNGLLPLNPFVTQGRRDP